MHRTANTRPRRLLPAGDGQPQTAPQLMEIEMTNPRRIAGLFSPALIAVTISESEFVNPHLYEHQIAPVLYLSGTSLFVAGLSIVRGHNRWTGGWPVLVTLMGWLAILGGLFRMFATELYQPAAQNTTALFVLQT